MALSPGTRLGHYDVTALLGEGGMGQVWQATDTQLNRQVALKILPDAFATDPDRLARFKREAQVLASLNHPNIAAIYGIEEAEGTRALVLELVEGPTLAERIAHGPIPVDDALPIARQMAEALEAAHERGVVHRDLKPANVKVKADGMVKVLDFGLAKAFDVDHSGATDWPTVTSTPTEPGVIMGTAPYLSPEQVRGAMLDRHSDIWAFGCVLFEVLTGRRAFPGATFSDTVAAILKEEPAFDSLAAVAPPRVQLLVRRCLQKPLERRLHDIGDARLEVEDALREPLELAPTRSGQTWPLGWVLTAAAVVTAFVAGAVGTRFLLPGAPSAMPESRLVVTLPPDQRLEDSRVPPVAISPDGTTLVYVASAAGGRTQLFRRSLDNYDATVIDGTEGATAPFFSPDGRWLGFYADGQLQRVSMSGGSPLPIAEAPPVWSATWSGDDSIIFATTLAATGL